MRVFTRSRADYVLLCACDMLDALAGPEGAYYCRDKNFVIELQS